MPFITSLFSLLFIATLMTWAYTYRSEEALFSQQTINFTQKAITTLFDTKQKAQVLEVFSKRCAPQNEEQHSQNKDDEKKLNRREIRQEEIKNQVSDSRNHKRASRFLHIPSLFDPSLTIDDQLCKAAFYVLKQLSALLFYEQEFYQRMDSGAGYEGIDVDTFFKSTIEQGRKVSQQNADGKKIPLPLKKAADLANLELEKPVEQYLLYKVLRGGGAGEVGAIGSYKSLLEYITLERRPTILNIYLAPRVLLMALFGNEKTVNHCCLYRKELYKKLRKDKSLKEELQNQFQTEFSNYLPSEVPIATVDFQISHTLPEG